MPWLDSYLIKEVYSNPFKVSSYFITHNIAFTFIIINIKIIAIEANFNKLNCIMDTSNTKSFINSSLNKDFASNYLLVVINCNFLDLFIKRFQFIFLLLIFSS